MAENLLKAQLTLEASQALQTLKAFVEQSKSLGTQAGSSLMNNLKNSIASVKIDISNGITVDKSKLAKIKADINSSLTSGKINKIDASSLLGNVNSLGGLGKQAGSSFGAGIVGGLTAALSGFSLGSIFSQIQGAVNSFKAVTFANLALGGAIKATNSRISNQTAILSDSNSSLEQKALTLGISTDKMYKNAAATKAGIDPSKALEQSLKNQTRAFENSIAPIESSLRAREKESESIDKESNALERKIKALKKETEEKVKNLKRNLGGDELEEQKKTIEFRKKNLEIEQTEAALRKDGKTFNSLDKQIKVEERSLSLVNDKLDLIGFQTDAIENQAKVQEKTLEVEKNVLDERKDAVKNTIDQIKQEISDKKIQFDIDIEPFKRKIEDVKEAFSAASGGGGGGKVLNQEFVDQVNSASAKAIADAENLKIDESKVNGIINNLSKKFGRTLKKSDITGAVGRLVQGGITSSTQIETLLERFVETASTNKRDGVKLPEAIRNLAQGFIAGRSEITENSGLTENFATNIDPKGVAVLRQQALAQGDIATATRLANSELTDAERLQARYYGTLQVTQDTTGNYQKALEAGLLSQEELNITTEQTSTLFGEALNPAFSEGIKFATDFLKEINKLVDKSPQLALVITGLATGLGVLAGVLGIATLASTLFGVTLGVALLPITLIILGIAALIAITVLVKKAWDENLFGIQQTSAVVFTQIKDYITSFKDNWQTRIGEIIGFFALLPIKLPLLAFEAIRKITEAFGIDWSMIWSGFGKAASSAFEYLKSLFTSENLKGLGNGVRDFIFGIVKGALVGLPGGESASKALDSIKRFAGGGLVKGKNVVAMLNDGDGDEFVMNAKSTRQNLPLLREMNNSKTSVDKSLTNNNNTNYYNYSTEKPSFGFNPKYNPI